MCVCVRVCVCVSVCVFARARARACVCVCVCSRGGEAVRDKHDLCSFVVVPVIILVVVESIAMLV